MNTDWQKYEANPDPKYNHTAVAFGKLSRRLEKEGLLPKERTLYSNWKRYLQMAASILLIAGFSSIAAFYLFNESSPFPNREYAKHHVKVINLQDGSQIILNEGSSLYFADHFSTHRAVKLKGEAFFTVYPDAKHPFTITANKGEVTVLGTSFNVKETKSNRLEVLVESGSVKLEAKKGAESSVILKTGMMGESDGKTASLIKKSHPNYLSWKTLDFKFSNTNLMDILHELEEAYHVSIVYERKDIENLRLTTRYQNQSIDTIIQTISTAFKMEYSKKGGKYYLKK